VHKQIDNGENDRHPNAKVGEVIWSAASVHELLRSTVEVALCHISPIANATHCGCVPAE
jgi:hypothetical protein